MRGRKPIPTKLKLLQGNPGKRPLPVEPEYTNSCDAPSFISGEAKAEWDRVSKELNAVGMLTAVDRSMLTAYCLAWQDFVCLAKTMKKEGYTTDKGKTPAYLAYENAHKRLIETAREFGFSPSARARVHAVTQTKTPQDQLKDFLQNKRIV